jgi:hypothetical protein
MMTSQRFTTVASLRLRQILVAVQIDRRQHALQTAVALRNLASEAYAAGMEDLGDLARRTEVDAVRWRTGDDVAESRARIARAVWAMLQLLESVSC